MPDLIAGGLRTKLEIGGADDPEERDADAVAKAVTQGQRAPCACGGTCAKCTGGGTSGTIRRKSDGGQDGGVAPASIAFAGSGRPLDMATRRHFEPRFGTSLARVRLHDDSRTASMAASIGARAYTVGHDIGFAEGRFSPETDAGRILLAHELAHVALGHGGLRRDGDDTMIKAADPVKETPKETTPMRPSSELAYFRGVPVANDAEFMRGEFRRMIGAIGMERADEWFQLFLKGDRGTPVGLPIMAHTIAFRRPVRSALDAKRDMREEVIWKEALPTVDTVYREVRAEALAFVKTFETNATTITNDILNASEAKAEAERIRYGLERTYTTKLTRHKESDGGYVTDIDVTQHDSMENQLPGQALTGAAKDLLAKRDEVSALYGRQSALEKTKCYKGECYESIPPENRAEHKRLGEAAAEKQREYDLIKGIYQERYPILGRLADDRSALATLSKGPSAKAAEVLNDQVLGTLENIREVRGQLGGKVNIWKLPEIVALAKAASGANDKTSLGYMRTRMVNDKVTQVEDDASFREKVMMALTIGLALIAAIPTGGGSLAAGAVAIAGIGAFTLSAIQAVEHLDKYMIEKAMAGTDFDRAKAIASSDPSLFWLAIDIVAAIADLGPAARGAKAMLSAGKTAFTTLAGAARRVAFAKGADAAQALADLRKAADAAESASGITGLAGRVAGSAEAVAKAGGSAEKALGKAAGNEAKAVAHGVAELESGVGQALAKSPTRLGGHSVSIMPNGWLVRCTVCSTLRAEFAVELGRNRELALRMFALEDSAAKAAKTGNKTLAKQVADDARVLSDELEAIRRTTEVRLYRGVAKGAADDIFLLDKRLVIDMPFVGNASKARNSAGWMRDNMYYWEELAKRHPEAFSPDNLNRIRGAPPLKEAVSPVNDEVFRSVFPQYDVKGMRGKPLIHHHIGGGGQAAAVPSPMHPGSGGIHNVEKEMGIWGAEDEVADMLQRLLDKTPAQ